MVQTSNRTCRVAVPSAKVLIHFKQCFAILTALALLISLQTARAEDITGDYLKIFSLIQRADSMNASGRAPAALAKYQEAKIALRKFQIDHPNYNAKMVAFRLGYLDEKVAALTKTLAPATPSPSTNSASATETRSPASTVPSGPQVKLIDAGAEPRKVLRLHPKVGAKQSAELSMKMTSEMKLGPAPAAVTKMPTIKMTMDVTVKSISPEGDLTYEMVLNDASVTEEEGVTPQVFEALKSSLAGIKGMTGTGVKSDRGFSKNSGMKLPTGADNRLSQILDQLRDALSVLSAPLPEEAIGAGAKWEIRSTSVSQGVTMIETTASQLASVDGEQLHVKSTLTQQAANQKMQNPGGLNQRVTSLKGNGTSEATIDLEQLLPPEATSNSSTETAMEMTVGSQKQTVASKMEMDMQLHAK
jgi:hypothetical protein